MKINTNYQLNKSSQSKQNFGILHTSHPNIMAEVLDTPAATREMLGILDNLRNLSDTVDTLAIPINDKGRAGIYLRVQKPTTSMTESKIPVWKSIKRFAQAMRILLKPNAKTKIIYHDEGPLGRNVLEQVIAFKKSLIPTETMPIEIETMPIEAAARSEWRETVC